MLHAALTFVFLAQSTDPSALEGKTEARPVERPVERGSPAHFSWGDFDGDARLDLAAVGEEGGLQLLANTGEGRFEDVSERVGLSGIGSAALALWVDYDADGGLDLFVGAREGTSRLFHNEGDLFVDMSDGSGLAVEGAVQSAHWLDHDGDGRLDLHVVTAEGNELFRGLEGGFFEGAELPLAGARPLPGGSFGSGVVDTPSATGTPTAAEGESGGRALDGRPMNARSSPAIRPIRGGSTSGPPGVAALVANPICIPSIEDQANPGSCLMASTTPALGRLYPLSANLFVAGSGNVGIGTTSPAAKLHVAGTARVTDTLTLAPAGDQALDVSTGSIYKGGALFIHTKGGTFDTNTAIGREALSNVTTGWGNTASGYRALFSTTGGGYNTACGDRALDSNTTGNDNTASGSAALSSNTTGEANTASGRGALLYNTSGSANTAGGCAALLNNTTGSWNTAFGMNALLLNTTGNHNTASGYMSLAFNTTGSLNTTCGNRALYFNTTGFRNTAMGMQALRSNTTGYRNTAVGSRALYANSTGYRNTACGYGALASSTATGNIALGFGAGQFLTTGNDNITIGHYGVAGEQTTIRIGTPGAHFRAFIAGIRGATTGVANAIPVLVDSNGQLGTISSSARFKEEIRDMDELTERLLRLRPVVFRYKPEVQEGERPLEYGLIAEEVAEVFPELVVHDDEGKPFTVKYHLLSSMLLNELKKLQAREECHTHEHEALRSRLAALEERVAAGFSTATR